MEAAGAGAEGAYGVGTGGVGYGLLYLDSPGSAILFMSSAGYIDLLGVGFEIIMSLVDTSDGFTISCATGPGAGIADAVLAAGSIFGTTTGTTASFFSSFGSSVLLALTTLVTLSSGSSSIGSSFFYFFYTIFCSFSFDSYFFKSSILSYLP